MSRLARVLGAVAFSLALVPTAHAQIVGLNHVWTVPGVMNSSGGVCTFITCTNAATASQTIGVDIYGAGGAHVTGNSLSVAANSTVRFGTCNATGVSVDVNLGTGTLTKGSARVLATSSKGILCSAFLADGVSEIPMGMVALPVAKKFSQKGD